MTDTPRRRATTDELIAQQEERLKQLKARKRREQARAREARKAMERKERARVLIEIGAALVEVLRDNTPEQQEGVLNAIANAKQGPDPKRRPEALAWMRRELGLPEPAAETPQESTAPAGATPPTTN